MDIIAVRCPNCGDTWNLQQITHLDDITYFSLASQDTDCHRCGKPY